MSNLLRLSPKAFYMPRPIATVVGVPCPLPSPFWGHACAVMQLQLLPRWAPARYQKLITQVAAIGTKCMTRAVMIVLLPGKECIYMYVCVCGVFHPTLGAHM